MTDSVTTLPTGSFRLSRIVYFEDLQRQNARTIPLGVIAELTLPSLRGLTMAARTTLLDDELRLIGPLMRDRLGTPFDYLEGEFNRAWRGAERGGALSLLMQEHASSLSFLAPKDLSVPRRWLLEEGGSALTSLVKARLMSTIDDEFYEMVLEDLIGSFEIPADFQFPAEPETVEKVAA